VQAADAAVGVNSGLAFVVDSLGDPEFSLVYTAPDPESFVDVKGVLQALETYRALLADALGDLLFFILVRMEELLKTEAGGVICPVAIGIR
jgi:chlorite dismutase